MALRLRDTTDNGFTVLQGQWSDPRLRPLTVKLTDGRTVKVAAGVLAGPVADLCAWSIRRWDDTVEPVTVAEAFDYRAKRDNDDNPSEHAAGTAWDVNAPKHPLDRVNAGRPAGWHMTGEQIAAVRALVAATNVDGRGPLLRAGGEWGDGMHLELAPGATSARVSAFLAQLNGAGAEPAHTDGAGAEPAPQTGEWLDMVSKDEFQQGLQPLVDAINGKASPADVEAQVRKVADAVFGPAGENLKHYILPRSYFVKGDAAGTIWELDVEGNARTTFRDFQTFKDRVYVLAKIGVQLFIWNGDGWNGLGSAESAWGVPAAGNVEAFGLVEQ